MKKRIVRLTTLVAVSAKRDSRIRLDAYVELLIGGQDALRVETDGDADTMTTGQRVSETAQDHVVQQGAPLVVGTLTTQIQTRAQLVMTCTTANV